MTDGGRTGSALAPALLWVSLRNMEQLFRKHFWAVHLLFLFAVTFAVARMANLFVESALLPLPRGGEGPRVQRPVNVVRPTATLDVERLAKATGIPLPPPEPEVTEPNQPVVDMNAPPVKSGLRLKLLGTLVSSLPEWSIASVQDAVTQRTQTYMVGDPIQGAEVLEIDRTRVIILNGGRREFIDGSGGDGAAPVAMAPPPVAPPSGKGPPSKGLGQGIRSMTENEYEVPRAEIDRTLSNLNDVAMQARIVPAFENGVAEGFKLFSIRPDSIYTKIGVQNGDVIRRINGFELNSPEKALEIYSKLKESSRIEIELKRNGTVVRKTYHVR